MKNKTKNGKLGELLDQAINIADKSQKNNDSKASTRRAVTKWLKSLAPEIDSLRTVLAKEYESRKHPWKISIFGNSVVLKDHRGEYLMCYEWKKKSGYECGDVEDKFHALYMLNIATRELENEIQKSAHKDYCCK